MSMFLDRSPVPSPTTKPKISAEERRRRHENRLKIVRLRIAIGRELDDRGIIDPVRIGAALGMPTAEAVKLMTRNLTRNHWLEGEVALLEAAAARFGLKVPSL